MRAALYTRVSSQEQAQHGVSLSEQKERLEAWAKLEGWDIAGIYTDEGHSGATDKRPGLQSLMEDARAKLFDIVAVSKLDRFFRNTRQLLNYVHDLDSNGITFVAQAEGIDTSKPGMGKIILSMLGSVAEWERERIGNRISDFRNHLARRGQWSSGRTPFGYRFDKAKKELLIDPLEAEAVRFIFNTYANNEIGIVRTAELCNQKEIITPRPGRRHHTTWTQSAIRHVLTHPAYKGGPNDDWVFNTPAIIPPELWNAAQRQLSTNRHFRDSESKSPYQGLLRCGLCGHTMRIGYNHSTSKVWECPGRLKRLHLDDSPRCILPRFDAKSLEGRMSVKIAKILNNPELLDKYIGDTINNLEKEKSKLERKLKPIQGNIKRIQESMTKADTMYQLGRLSTEDYKSRITGLRARLQELERQTTEADPLLLGQLKETDKLLKYWAGYSHMMQFFAKQRGKKLKVPALDAFFTLQALSPSPKYPQEPAGHYLKQLGLFIYIYPKHIEIKGVLRPINITAGYRSGRCPRFR